ncbi:hypothetical protein FPRO05_12128 [Fusarium proliferatum]|uniref:Heterokaryon incompatibility domain-containing protein n=1 Tax=Gibberella intermedia TaxID=948311 RepID=A0A365N532_GIBIN|nr:hypothetical protein FPRO05_12128 [Fusarium proliferatum]
MYSALDSSRREIRLLRLFAGSGTGSVKCELYTTSLDCPDEYEALSYVWGNPKDCRSITIDGKEKDITKNLESALRHLRHRNRPRTVWADALCINQDDLQEKTLQVRQMGNIYSKASQVLVWLGPEDNKTSAVDIIQKFAADRELHWNNTGDEWKLFQLYFFLSKDWWSRVWTVQELVLAKRVVYHCGWKLISDSDMRNMVSSYNLHKIVNRCCNSTSTSSGDIHTDIGADLAATMQRLSRIIQFQEHIRRTALPFDQISLEFNVRNATDPRDKVYGFLGISQGVSADSINYKLTTAEVFETTTREFLNYSENLDLLSHCVKFELSHRKATKTTSGLPSWVPDWGVRRVPSGGDLDQMVYRIPFLQAYKASGELKYVPSTHFDKGILTVSGVLCDTIGNINGQVRNRIFTNTWTAIHEWRKLIGVDEDPGRPYIAGGTVEDAFWRTICLDISAGSGMLTDVISKPRRAGDGDRSIYLEYWYRELVRHYGLQQPDSSQQPFNVMLFEQHVMKTTAKRRFFISMNGFIGLAPPDAEVGDMICVFAGGKVPYVVRNLTKRKQQSKGLGELGIHCSLLGDAYVHGLMDGGAVEMIDGKAKVLETFKLH